MEQTKQNKIVQILNKEPDELAEELLNDIEKIYGEIPYILNFMRQYPELMNRKILYDNQITRESKNIDPKTIELISIGVAAALRCENCLRLHIRVAQRMGITKKEIFDAILIAGSLSNNAVLAGSTRAMRSEIKD